MSLPGGNPDELSTSCRSALRENSGKPKLGPLWVPLPPRFAYIGFALYPFDVKSHGPGDDLHGVEKNLT